MSNPVKDHVDKTRLAHLVSAGLRLAEPVHSGTCVSCGRYAETIARRRLNTAYTDDQANYAECCAECFEEAVEHYREMWAAVYS